MRNTEKQEFTIVYRTRDGGPDCPKSGIGSGQSLHGHATPDEAHRLAASLVVTGAARRARVYTGPDDNRLFGDLNANRMADATAVYTGL
jgi:hypothetical protein